MPFKFVNWFLEQQETPGLLGRIAKKCLEDKKFPTQSKHPQDIIDYLKSKNASKNEILEVKKAWNEYRKLGKVKAKSLSIIKAKI